MDEENSPSARKINGMLRIFKPRAKASGQAQSQGTVAKRFLRLDTNRKDITVVFRWLVILILLCFLFFSPEEYPPGKFMLLLGLILAYLASNVVLSLVSDKVFEKSRISRFIFFLDILVISGIMYFIRGFETDLYLVYFLIIFVAAMQHGGIRRSWITGLVTAVLYMSLYLRNNSLDSLLSSYVLLRIPFFFLVSVFSAYHSEQLGKEVVRRKEAEEKSLEVLQQYKTLVDTIPDIIFEVDGEGQFTFISEAVRETGYAPEDLLGKHFSSVIHPDDAGHVSRKVMLEVLRGQATGEKGSPKLFDERRTGTRMTKNLVVKMMRGPSATGREPFLYIEMHSSGKWRVDAATGQRTLLGSFGVIRDMKVPAMKRRAGLQS